MNRRLHLPLAALGLSLVVGCGRSTPAPQRIELADVDTRATAAAKAACFDEEAELTAALDDNYVAADTPLLGQGAVEQFARDVCLDSEAELIALLDNDYVRQAAVEATCFDNESELFAVLDDDYRRVGVNVSFTELDNVPADLADGDQDTTYTATAPLAISGANDISISGTGCANGDLLTFVGAAGFDCQPPAPLAVADSQAVGAAGANTAPLEALPIVIKLEVTVSAAQLTAAGVNVDTNIYVAGARAPRNLLIIDAWTAGTALTGAPTWHLRDGATQITNAVAAPDAAEVVRISGFNNNGARNVSTADDLRVRVTASAAAEAATFTAYVLALPL